MYHSRYSTDTSVSNYTHYDRVFGWVLRTRCSFLETRYRVKYDVQTHFRYYKLLILTTKDTCSKSVSSFSPIRCVLVCNIIIPTRFLRLQYLYNTERIVVMEWKYCDSKLNRTDGTRGVGWGATHCEEGNVLSETTQRVLATNLICDILSR